MPRTEPRRHIHRVRFLLGFPESHPPLYELIRAAGATQELHLELGDRVSVGKHAQPRHNG